MPSDLRSPISMFAPDVTPSPPMTAASPLLHHNPGLRSTSHHCPPSNPHQPSEADGKAPQFRSFGGQHNSVRFLEWPIGFQTILLSILLCGPFSISTDFRQFWLWFHPSRTSPAFCKGREARIEPADYAQEARTLPIELERIYLLVILEIVLLRYHIKRP